MLQWNSPTEPLETEKSAVTSGAPIYNKNVQRSHVSGNSFNPPKPKWLSACKVKGDFMGVTWWVAGHWDYSSLQSHQSWEKTPVLATRNIHCPWQLPSRNRIGWVSRVKLDDSPKWWNKKSLKPPPRNPCVNVYLVHLWYITKVLSQLIPRFLSAAALEMLQSHSDCEFTTNPIPRSFWDISSSHIMFCKCFKYILGVAPQKQWPFPLLFYV